MTFGISSVGSKFDQVIRLHYLEAVLFTTGQAGTPTLTALGVTRQQASADIGEYLRLAGAAMVYRPSLKVWTLDKRYRPHLLPRDKMERYIAAVELIPYS